MRKKQFIAFLEKETFLKEVLIDSKISGKKSLSRYLWREASPLEIALSLKPNSYLTHASALFYQSLTDSVPKYIFVNYEQLPKSPRDEPLSQDEIDLAFSSPQRESKNIYNYDGLQIVLLNGKNTKHLEVGTITINNLLIPVTKIERTLIDAVVRPIYSGGVYQVLKAFETARTHSNISISVLLATLKKLEFVYPYHQAIGFFLQRAGYNKEQYDRFKALGINYKFYLSYDIREPEYNKEWQLVIPKGF
jgi:hypothetical protein